MKTHSERRTQRSMQIVMKHSGICLRNTLFCFLKRSDVRVLYFCDVAEKFIKLGTCWMPWHPVVGLGHSHATRHLHPLRRSKLVPTIETAVVAGGGGDAWVGGNVSSAGRPPLHWESSVISALTLLLEPPNGEPRWVKTGPQMQVRTVSPWKPEVCPKSGCRGEVDLAMEASFLILNGILIGGTREWAPSLRVCKDPLGSFSPSTLDRISLAKSHLPECCSSK